MGKINNGDLSAKYFNVVLMSLLLRLIKYFVLVKGSSPNFTSNINQL